MERIHEKLHPKLGLRLIFKNEYGVDNFRVADYLRHFKIIKTYPIYKFIPLNLTFDSYEELYEFLHNRGILSYEIELPHKISSLYSGIKPVGQSTVDSIKEKVIILDTQKIYEVEESTQKYLMNYKYYSINEVAEMLSFSRPTVYKIINDGKLNSIRINGQKRIKHSALDEYIKNENLL